ncbi:hypothetical protein GGS20DRAFT_549731 [Poronia punctata]|nr:hypothetical protein GGS20DRAFT_549731 [Poronia punctata]
MRASIIIYTILTLISPSLSLAKTTADEKQNIITPGTCPWDTTLRSPACPSADFLREQDLTPPFSVSLSQSKQRVWKGPEHCVNGTCIFSNAVQNGGIALITGAAHAKTIQEYEIVADDGGGADPSSFVVEDVPGKGVGLRATRFIAKGEVLMVRSPTLMVRTDSLEGMDDSVRDLMYEVALARLPKSKREAFDAQMGSGVHGKINTNSFQMFVAAAGEQPARHFGSYPDIARMNHDCRPNMHYRIENMTITSLAARDIHPGEELNVSYINVFLTSKERKERIRQWGFECACSLCQAPRNETAASDRRLRRIGQLKDDLNNFKEIKVTADTGAEYVALHEQEGLHAHLGSAYTRAALNFALFGDETRAREYARRAVEELEMEKGPGCADAKAMRGLAENPKAHWTFGKRRTVEKS